MEINVTFESMAALFAAMVILAAIPSISVITVSARAASSGFIHGAFTALGIVAGDIIFILLAILGLSVLVETMGNLFVLVKYLGAAYLAAMGIQLWRSASNSVAARNNIAPSLLSSFLAGLFITLGDHKAILFYLVFFPAVSHCPGVAGRAGSQAGRKVFTLQTLPPVDMCRSSGDTILNSSKSEFWGHNT